MAYIREITRQLCFIGMNPRLKGYSYSRRALEAVLEEERADCTSMKQVYRQVAQKEGTSPGCVERNIRYAVEDTWMTGNLENIFALFGYTVSAEKGKPTNAEFLLLLADKIRHTEWKEEIPLGMELMHLEGRESIPAIRPSVLRGTGNGREHRTGGRRR